MCNYSQSQIKLKPQWKEDETWIQRIWNIKYVFKDVLETNKDENQWVRES